MIHLKLQIPIVSLKVLDMLKKVPKELREKALNEMSVKVSTAYAKKLRDNIKNQTLGHQPLSTKWADYKRHHGLDPRILIATGKYVRSIRVKRISANEVEIGTTSNYGPIHEGLKGKGKRMPVRPHWMPTIAQMNDPTIIKKCERIMLRVFNTS